MEPRETAALWALASLRHGVVTTGEILALVGESGLKQLLAKGFLQRKHFGVYVVAGAPATPMQDLACIALATRSVIASKSRGALDDVPFCTLLKPHFLRSQKGTISRDFDERRLRFHRTNFLPAHHVEEIDGVPGTTLVRALCDMSASMSLSSLEKAVDSCKRRGLIEYEELAICREELRARGRRKTTLLDDVLAERVDGYQVGETPPEDKIIRWVGEAGFEPSPQHWVVANGNRRRIDVAIADDKVAVEYQGLKEHATEGAVENDSEKLTDLQLAGWFIVLVTKKTTKAKFTRELKLAIDIQRQAHGPLT
ncbi:MAG: hypothetical protein Q8K63_14255 [Acidimicrobiales bacterium]|nr:hypothetical protein [Acidimicrobiales bacterium]